MSSCSAPKFNPDTDIPDLSGKSIFITGGTAGLGASSALHLSKHNPAHIYLSGRNAKSAEGIISQIRDSGSTTQVTFVECDLASLSSIKTAMEKFTSQTFHLDILMCNAGIMAKPPGLTTDGYEVQFGTNHLGHALIIQKLLPLLEQTAQQEGGDARIVILTSQGLFMHPKPGVVFDTLRTEQDFGAGGPWLRYGQSKLANLLYARELSCRYPSITSVAIHPGVVTTGLVDSLSAANKAFVYATTFWKQTKPEEGSFNQLWAATVPKDKIESGHYYEPVGVESDKKLDKTALDGGLSGRLWDWTEDALKEYN